MKISIQYIQRFVIASIMMLTLIGCVAPQPVSPRPVVPKQEVSAQTFQETASKAPNAIQSAIELSQKCAELSEQLSALKEKNLTLNTENEALRKRISEIEPQLAQTEKELQEASDLLIEMRLDLNTWKDRILGYRSEMRDANQAQLEALLKILQLLGGEIMLETPEDQNTPTVSEPNV